MLRPLPPADDFEGPSPHNVNLALKGILGLGAFSLLLNYSGQMELGAAYWSSAQGFVQDWLRMALDDSGDHYRLQYDLSGTWSTKYNLVYQYILGLPLFPQSVADMEVAWYLSHARQFGVPLDSRSDMVKCDWLSWAAAFASSQEDAEALLHFLFLFADGTPSRAPFSDWYNSTTNRQIGFTARPVMGGLYARPLVHSAQPAAANHAQAERAARAAGTSASGQADAVHGNDSVTQRCCCVETRGAERGGGRRMGSVEGGAGRPLNVCCCPVAQQRTDAGTASQSSPPSATISRV